MFGAASCFCNRMPKPVMMTQLLIYTADGSCLPDAANNSHANLRLVPLPHQSACARRGKCIGQDYLSIVAGDVCTGAICVSDACMRRPQAGAGSIA